MASPPSPDRDDAAADRRDASEGGGDRRLVAVLCSLKRMGLPWELRRAVCEGWLWELRAPIARAELDAAEWEEWGNDHDDYRPSLAWSPNGGMLAGTCMVQEDKETLSPDKVPIMRVWDVAEGGEGRDVRGHNSEHCPSCSEDLVPDAPGFDATSCPVPGHSSCINALAFSPDGATLCSVSDDCTIRMWDVATMEERCRMHAALEHHGVAFSGDGTQLLACLNCGLSDPASDAVRVWDVSKATPPPPLVLTPPDEGMVVCSAAFTTDDARVVACCKMRVDEGEEDGYAEGAAWQGCIVTWKLEGGAPEVHEVAGLVWDYGRPDDDCAEIPPRWSIGAGGKLSTAVARRQDEQAETVLVVDMASGAVVGAVGSGGIVSADVSAGGTHVLLTCKEDLVEHDGPYRYRVELWSLRTMQMVWSAPSSNIAYATFGPDGRTFVTAALDRKRFIVWG